jgi:hypothetical protein
MRADYRRIPIWETKRRIGALGKFVKLLSEYANLLQPSANHWTDEQTSDTQQEISSKRVGLDLECLAISRIVQGADISLVFNWTPLPIVGGYEHRVNLITDMFQLQKHGTGLDALLDVLIQAMGVYQHDVAAAWVRTLNPFYWVSLPIEWVSYLPFRIVGFLGGDVARASDSFFGRLLQGTLMLGQTILAYLAIAEKLGLLGSLRGYFLTVFRTVVGP